LLFVGFCELLLLLLLFLFLLEFNLCLIIVQNFTLSDIELLSFFNFLGGLFRMLGLVLFVFVNSLEDTVHLRLKQVLQLFDHDLVDRASLDKVFNEALHGVTFVDNNALETEGSNVDVHVQLRFSFVKGFGASLLSICIFDAVLDAGGARLNLDVVVFQNVRLLGTDVLRLLLFSHLLLLNTRVSVLDFLGEFHIGLSHLLKLSGGDFIVLPCLSGKVILLNGLILFLSADLDLFFLGLFLGDSSSI